MVAARSLFWQILLPQYPTSALTGAAEFFLSVPHPVCVCACMCVRVLSCAVKFLCQIKSSLTRLQQTPCDSVQGRPNRAPIQPPATGSLLSTESFLTVLPLREGRKTAAQHLDGALPMYLSDMSLCYCEFILQTSRATSEYPGGAPVWGITSPGLCCVL